MPRNALSRISVGVLLSAAALLLAGCWGTHFPRSVVGGPNPDSHIVVVHERNSAETIFTCTAITPNPREAAECALAVTRLACVRQPLPAWSRCLEATDWVNPRGCRPQSDPGPGTENCAVSMRKAMDGVLGNQECLAYEYKAAIGESYGWTPWNSGSLGCP